MTHAAALRTADAVLALLDDWVDMGWLRDLDQVFAAFLAREAPDAPPLLLLAGALASHQLARGHSCLELDATLADARETLALPPERPWRHETARGARPVPAPPSEVLSGVDLAQWLSALRHPALVATVGDEPLEMPVERSERAFSEGPIDGDAGAGESGAGESGGTPLVCAGTRLYLRRYWQYEQTVRAALTRRLAPRAPMSEREMREVRRMLDALFGVARGDDAEKPHRRADPQPDQQADRQPNWQRIACALALRAGFTIVTGGPGTGKTTTVVKLLALLQHLALSRAGEAEDAGTDAGVDAGADAAGRPLRISLAAPTGKAAARLGESIANAVAGLAVDGLPHARALRAAIPLEVVTVHRLLGSLGGSRRYRHDANNPLPLDVLVLDEASMVDLEMMAAVLDALPAHARLVLLGDKDQLASVEAGNVLGALCQRADAGHYQAGTRDWLRAVSGERVPDALMDAQGLPLDQAVVKLRHSYRFGAASGIGRLAEAVNAGDIGRVDAVRASGASDLAWIELDADDAALRRLVLDGAADADVDDAAVDDAAVAGRVGYRHYLRELAATRPHEDADHEAFDAWARTVLAAYGRFQLLCAVRQGPQGVEVLNQRVAALLHAERLVDAAQGWYVGRPVMVTKNDYTLGLMNGDVGVTLEVPVRGASGTQPVRRMPRVAFASSDGGIRWALPSRLRNVDTVYAMTVHKSQGSEFAHAALLLPQGGSRVLTRELVYTGITRAKTWFTVALPPGGERVLREAVERRTRRSGGLMNVGR